MPETVTQRKMAQLPPETCQLKAADDQTSGPGRLCLQWPPDLLHFKFGGIFSVHVVYLHCVCQKLKHKYSAHGP